MLLRTESWTAAQVLAHFEVAATTLRLLNREGQKSLRAYWPAMRRDQKEMWAQAVACGCWKALASRQRVATVEELRILDEVLVWSGWIIDSRARKLVWGRAFGVPWRILTHQIGLRRTWGQRLVTEGLIQVA